MGADVGLVLTGGGARGAYQVGVLKGLAQILPGAPFPFRILTGTSAGAINAFSLSCRADSFPRAAQHLEEAWLALTPQRVYRTDFPSLTSIALRWFGALAGGGAGKGATVNHLLDTAPLREFLLEQIPVDKLHANFRSGALKAVALSATNYLTGTAITFFEGAEEIAPWARTTRLGRRQMLTVDHVMASSAIPLFFPPVQLDGAFYGDGCVRLTAPLSPAIHLGAEKIVAISVRYPRTGQETTSKNEEARQTPLSLAEISGVLMNAVFLDAVEADAERLQRVNKTLELIPASKLPQGLRPIPVLLLRPSRDLGELAFDQHGRFPGMLRYLLSGLGAGEESGHDLLSYLAFERAYVGTLINLGYADTLARKDELLAFFAA
jgi:NTE family protein